MPCIVRLKGGLGNQLFQYAFGRAVSRKHSTELLLDLSQLSSPEPNTTPRTFDLGPFSLPGRLITKSEGRKLGIPGGRAGLWLARRGYVLRSRKYVFERGFGYDPEVTEHPDAIFEGYWQSERYFGEVRADLLRDVRLTPSGDFGRLAEKLHRPSSVSVHVRRGDYVTNPVAAAAHGLCSVDFYRAAFEFIEGKVARPQYYVFTDDPAWLAQNRSFFGRPVNIVAEFASLRSQEELMLMSLCEHHILANSSFSWWGAWLGERERGLVIAPRRWFPSETDTSDLIPDRWHRL